MNTGGKNTLSKLANSSKAYEMANQEVIYRLEQENQILKFNLRMKA